MFSGAIQLRAFAPYNQRMKTGNPPMMTTWNQETGESERRPVKLPEPEPTKKPKRQVRLTDDE